MGAPAGLIAAYFCTAVPMQRWATIMSGALLASFGSACAAPERSPADPAWLCFRHIGPEDKPMPEFCIWHRSAPSKPDGGVIWRVPEAAAWQHLQAACARQTTAGNYRQFGTYRVEPAAPASGCDLSAQDLRLTLLALGRNNLPNASDAPAGWFEALLRRLEPMSRG